MGEIGGMGKGRGGYGEGKVEMGMVFRVLFGEISCG